MRDCYIAILVRWTVATSKYHSSPVIVEIEGKRLGRGKGVEADKLMSVGGFTSMHTMNASFFLISSDSQVPGFWERCRVCRW